MENEKELKFLLQLQKKLESEKQSILLKPWFNPLLWLFCALLFFVAFQLFEQTNNSFTLVILTIIFGVVIGVVFIYQNSERSWVYLKKYLSQTEIEKLINSSKT